MMNELKQQLGRLVVKQFGNSTVFVDGRFAGYSDEMNSMDHAMPIAEGTHEVVIVAPTGQSRALQVRILAGAAALVLPGIVMIVRS